MKVGIVGFADLRYMPYLRNYTNLLDRLKIDYEVIYWNRRELDDQLDCQTHAYNIPMDDGTPKLYKASRMWRYCSFVRKMVRKQEYDFLIVLTTLPAVMLSRLLTKKYRQRYIVDIRDYTYERYRFYYLLLQHTLSSSALSVISAPGFKHFLPEGYYTLCHNYQIKESGKVQMLRTEQTRSRDVLRISYIGAIGYYHEVIPILQAIGNDPRFKFTFYGSGIDEAELQDFCLEHDINNVHFKGIYAPHEKDSFYQETDILFNVYGNHTLTVQYAISNKLYEAAHHRIPILVSPNTMMEAASGVMGYPLKNSGSTLADDIYHWYHEQIDWEELDRHAETLLDQAAQDHKLFEKRVTYILRRSEAV